MNNELKIVRTKMDKNSLTRMFHDLCILMLICMITMLLGSMADPWFIRGIGLAIVLVLGASMAVAVYCAMINGSRILSLSIGAMLQTGLTVQALLLQDYYGRDEEVLRYAMLVVFCVAAALILVPLFMGFFRESVVDTVAENLPTVMCYLLPVLLILISNSGSGSFDRLITMWPMPAMVLALPVFSLNMVRPDAGNMKRIMWLVVYLVVGGCYLLVVNAVAQLVVLVLTVMVLACLLLRERKALLIFLGITVGLAAGCVLVTWLCSAANHSGVVLPDLLKCWGRMFDKLALRMDLLFNGGDPLNEAYQITRVRMALSQSLLLPNADYVYFPVAQNTAVFAGLIHRLGLLCGIGVLGIVACMFRSGLRICKHASSTHAGGVGMAFVLYLTINALLSVASTLGLMPAIGLDFPLLSSSGTSLAVYSFMLVCLLCLSGEDNQHEEATWKAPRREKIAVCGVLACCVVLAIACCVMVFFGGI